MAGCPYDCGGRGHDRDWKDHTGYPVDQEREYVVTEAGERISPMASTTIHVTKSGRTLEQRIKDSNGMGVAVLDTDLKRTSGVLQPGDVAAINPNNGQVVKASSSNDRIIGIVDSIDPQRGVARIVMN